MDQSYQQSINSIKTDISEITAAMAALDVVIANSATNLANAAGKLSAATPNDMTKVINDNAKALENYINTVQKSQTLEVKYAQEQEKLAKIIADRVAKEASDQEKLTALKLANSKKAIDAQEKEAAAITKAQNTAIANTEKLIKIEEAKRSNAQKQIKDAEAQRLSELNLAQAREKAFDDYDALIQKKAAAQEKAAEKERLSEIELQKAREKAFDDYDKQIEKKNAAAQKAIQDAEKERLAEIDLYKAREKAFDDFNRKEEQAFQQKAAAAQREAAQDANQIANQRALAKAADLEAQATSKLAGAYNNLIARREQAKIRLQNLISSTKQNNVEISKAQREYDLLTARINQANSATQNFAKGGLMSAVNGIKGLLAAFGMVGGLYMFADMAKQGFNLARTLDALNFAQKTIIADSQELARTQTFLAQITEDYGAAVVTTTERYTKFLAAAKQSNVPLADTEKIFGTMTKAAGALGLKAHELEGIFLALEQMLSKGKVTTEELRRQLGERLPGAFGIMAKSLNVTVAELDDMLRKGEIMSAEALPKFAEEVERAYGIENLKKVENLNASVTRLSNSWVKFIGDLTKSEGAVSKFMMGTIDMADAVIKKFGIILSSFEDLMDESRKLGDGDMLSDLQKASEDYGVSMEELATKNLPLLQAELDKTTKEFEEQNKRLQEWKDIMPEDGFGVALFQSWISGMETTTKETGILMAKQQGMLKVLETYSKREEALRDQVANPFNLQSYEEVQLLLKDTGERYNLLTKEIDKVKASAVLNPQRLSDLEVEQANVKALNDQYTELAETMKNAWMLPMNFKAPAPVDPNADRNFIADKLKQAQEKYAEIKWGDDKAKFAIEAEIKILEKALEFWDGAAKKKEKAVKDYTAQDAFTLTEGRLQRELDLQKAIRDNEELGTNERLDAQRNASVKEIELLRWRKDEAVRLAAGRTDLIKNINEQFFADLMRITEEGYKQIDDIEAQGFDQRLQKFDERIAADKFAMDKEVENIRAIGIRRGWSVEYIEAQVLAVKEKYLQKQLEAQIDYALKELQVYAVTGENKEEVEKRLHDLRKQLNDIQLKRLKDSEDAEIKSWEDRKAAAMDYINAIGDIGNQIGQLLGTFSDRRMQAIDEELQASNDMYAQMLENEYLTDQQREDLMKAQEAREKELNEKKKAERIKQAQAEKKFMLFEIAIQTALNIVKAGPNLFLAAMMATLGALQAAVVIASPIPQYAKGRRGGKEEYAWLGDGGKQEAILDNNQKLVGITPAKPTIMKLKAGQTVLPDLNQIKPKHFDSKDLKSEYEHILNATIRTNLANASQNMDVDRLAQVFDAKLRGLKKEVREGIKDGFNNIKMPANNGNKELADRLKFLSMRDAI